jgi:hypothetical protein
VALSTPYSIPARDLAISTHKLAYSVTCSRATYHWRSPPRRSFSSSRARCVTQNCRPAPRQQWSAESGVSQCPKCLSDVFGRSSAAARIDRPEHSGEIAVWAMEDALSVRSTRPQAMGHVERGTILASTVFLHSISTTKCAYCWTRGSGDWTPRLASP